MIATTLTRRFGLHVPLIQAPMGGGPTTPALVAAVSNAGALGSIAAGYLPPDVLREQVREVRRLTDRSFAINVFAPSDPSFTDADVEHAARLLEPYRTELGLSPRPGSTQLVPDHFDDQIEVILEAPPPIVSFTFGTLPPPAAAALQGAGCVLVGTATTTAEAHALVEAGTDVVCVQGAEAGAHRGSFLTDTADGLVGTLALTRLVTAAVDVPVIAAGGIMDGPGVAAVLALGAGAAQLGTAFLRCPEAGTSETHRTALAAADDTSTVVTAAFTGRPARGIDNRLARELVGSPVPAYPVMNSLTAELRRTAAQLG
ncbi:MAG: nitronate monooxygenase, partial [Dehalococcoidia bacterium]